MILLNAFGLVVQVSINISFLFTKDISPYKANYALTVVSITRRWLLCHKINRLDDISKTLLKILRNFSTYDGRKSQLKKLIYAIEFFVALTTILIIANSTFTQCYFVYGNNFYFISPNVAVLIIILYSIFSGVVLMVIMSLFAMY